MTILILGNAAIDESMAAPTWPTPGATVLVGPPARDLGGKGANQAIVLARTGAPMRFVATIGNDDTGRWIRSELAAEGLDTSHLIELDAPSDRSLIFVALSGENAIASTSHCSDALTPSHAEAAIATMAAGDTLITQGGLTADTTAAAFTAARTHGLSIVFNPSALRPGFRDLIGQADLLVLNRHEAIELTGTASPAESARALQATGARTIIITLGPDGALARDDIGEIQIPAAPAKVLDTTGAGDCYLAILVAATHHRHLPLRPAMQAAANAASIAISRRGTRAAFPTATEIATILA